MSASAGMADLVCVCAKAVGFGRFSRQHGQRWQVVIPLDDRGLRAKLANRMHRPSPNRPGRCPRTRFASLARSPRSSSGITTCQRWPCWREKRPKPTAFAHTHTRSAMPALADIQADIRDALVRGDRRAVAPMLSGGAHPEHRLAIHQRHYAASLTRALLDRFPATVWLVGSALVTDA